MGPEPTAEGAPLGFPFGRLAQRESARFTRERSLVRSQYRPHLRNSSYGNPVPLRMAEQIATRQDDIHCNECGCGGSKAPCRENLSHPPPPSDCLTGAASSAASFPAITRPDRLRRRDVVCRLRRELKRFEQHLELLLRALARRPRAGEIQDESAGRSGGQHCNHARVRRHS